MSTTQVMTRSDARRSAARERRCAVTRRKLAPAQAVRFVTAPDGRVVADLDDKLPGRGLWVGAERALIERAVRKGVLARAGRVDADIADRIEAQLARRCRDLLGLARRAGQLVCGFEAVRAALADGEAVVLVAARDGAPGPRARLARLARAAGAPAPVAVLDRAELGAALGRENTVHAALGRGRLAERFAAEARRLAGFRARADDDFEEAERR